MMKWAFLQSLNQYGLVHAVETDLYYFSVRCRLLLFFSDN